ncbi:MAG: nitrite reductase small subunit NirD [Pseudomonadota bacterium]
MADSAAASDEAFVTVCALDDILPDTGVAALIAGRPVAIFRVGASPGDLFALGNVDPFSKASVLSRGIVGDVAGATVVASPIYKQHFRLADGVCVEDASVSVPVYAVRVVDGHVAVCAAAAP